MGVPLGTALIEGFKDLDFHDEYAVRDFLSALTGLETQLDNKKILLHIVSDIVYQLLEIVKLDDSFESDAPFHILGVDPDTPFEVIESRFNRVTTQMRADLAMDLGEINLALQRDLVLHEKAFRQV